MDDLNCLCLFTVFKIALLGAIGYVARGLGDVNKLLKAVRWALAEARNTGRTRPLTLRVNTYRHLEVQYLREILENRSELSDGDDVVWPGDLHLDPCHSNELYGAQPARSVRSPSTYSASHKNHGIRLLPVERQQCVGLVDP